MARAKTRSSTKAKSKTSSSRSKTASRVTRGKQAVKRVARSAASATSRAARGNGSAATRSRTTAARARSTTPRTDAVTLLKNDHQQVEEMFQQFEKARSTDRKRELASNICSSLRVHARIEEEIFYPAFYEVTREEDIHHEAVVEHDGAKKLIAEIESTNPEDEYFDARVKVLGEMIRHHVREEESRDGMFGKARGSRMDLKALGEQMAALKMELESSPDMMKALGRAKDAGLGMLSRLTTASVG